MLTFRKGSKGVDWATAAKTELDNMFREAVGFGEKKMDPYGVQKIDAERVDIGQTIVKLVNEEIETINVLPLLVDEVTGDIRDDYMWQELDGGLRVVDRSYGTKPISSRLTFKEHGMKTSHKEIAVHIPLEEVFSGRLTPAMAIAEMALTINRYRVSLVLSAIDAAIPSAADRTGLSGYTLRYTSASALTQAVVDKALDGLQDENESATIFGRHIALFPAMRAFTVGNGVADRSAIADNELFARGVIGQYHGANIVTLRDPYAKRFQEHLIAKNKVWITASRRGAIYMRKDVSFLDYTVVDPRSSTFEQGIRLEDGVMMTDPYLYRIVTITGI